MYMKLRTIICAAICLLACISAGGKSISAAKKISRQFAVRPADKLLIDNTYGRVKVQPWDKNEITVDILMEARAKTQAEANELLERISVTEGNKNGVYSFETVIAKAKNNIISCEFDISYIVRIPYKNALSVTNKYGDVSLMDFEGALDLDISYGDLFLSGSHGPAQIKMAFGDATIQYMKKGKVNMSYGDLRLSDADELDITSKYGDTKIDTIGELHMLQEYGDLKIRSVAKMDGHVSYSDMEVNTLQKSMDITLQYSGITTLREIGPNVSLVKINAQYSDLALHMASANLAMDVMLSFGDLHGAAAHKYLTPVGRADDSNMRRYHGKTGNGSGKLDIDVSYGDVAFK